MYKLKVLIYLSLKYGEHNIRALTEKTCTSFHILLRNQARINRRRVARAHRTQPLCSDKEVGNVSMFKTGEQFCHVS